MALSLSAAAAGSLQLAVIEQTLHTRHRAPPGVRHAEVPERLVAARDALVAAPFAGELVWERALDSGYSAAAAVEALKRVHSLEHLRTVEEMSQTGGGFDTDTYCAPGSWEAMLDGTRTWLEATTRAAAGDGPAVALTRPAGHHATRDVAMGFGLVNFAAAAVASHLHTHPESRVSILDWDVHHGNGVAAIFADEPRVRYASTHEAGGFPGTGMDTTDRGAHANLLSLPLPKGAGGDAYLRALWDAALPFLLTNPKPDLLLICGGFDALEADPLATMTLTPDDFATSVRMIVDEFGFPPSRVALGLEGGYSLDSDAGMPAALVATCGALLLEGPPAACSGVRVRRAPLKADSAISD
mgnify:CR=1 FL=1